MSTVEHWIIEAVLFATGVTIRQWVEGTKSQHGSASRRYVATIAIVLCITARSKRATQSSENQMLYDSTTLAPKHITIMKRLMSLAKRACVSLKYAV